MKGTAIKQIDTNIKVVPKNKSLLWDGSINLVPKPGPDTKHAKVTPAAFALHNSDISWFPTPTWLKKGWLKVWEEPHKILVNMQMLIIGWE